MGINIFRIDTFTDKIFQGTPICVVPDASNLDDETLQNIAIEMNTPHMSFVTDYFNDTYSIRYFTPEKEVDFSSYGTIGTFYTLATKGYIRGIENGYKEVVQRSKRKDTKIELYYEDWYIKRVYIKQKKAKIVEENLDYEDIYDALNLNMAELDGNIYGVKPAIVEIDYRDLIIPIFCKGCLKDIEPDYDKILKICKDQNIRSFHLFYIRMIGDTIANVRNFAPVLGIEERKANVTANGALTYYLKKNGLLGKDRVLIKQGKHLNRPSEVYCKIDEDGIVSVGGHATLVIDGIVCLDRHFDYE